jgi:hypothetical protein
MGKVSTELVTSMMKLTVGQPWLKDKIVKVAEVLEECDTEDQQKLVLEMLYKFSYIDEAEYTNGLTSMVDYLFEKCGIKPSETQLYGLQISRDTDSSNEVAYRVRSITGRNIGSGIKVFGTMNRIPEIPLQERPYIVLVDEFIGSGQTARIRLAHLFQRAKEQKITLDPSKIYLCYLAGMDFALNNLRAEFSINIYCYLELKKGIASHYKGELKDKAYKDMKLLEGSLSDPCPETKLHLPSLGYGGAEALYYREEGNPPNSNFPFFWWSYRKTHNGSDVIRAALIRRAS